MATAANEWPIERPNGLSMWLLVACIDGAMVVTDTAHSVRLQPGDLVLYPAHSPQYYRRDPACPRWEHRWAALPSVDRWQAWLDWPERCGAALIQRSLGLDWPQRLKSLMDDLVESTRQQDDRYQALAGHVFGELLLRVQVAAPAQGDAVVQAACAAMQRRLAYDWSVAELAILGGVSPSRFAHRFRAATGLSPMRWRDQQRMQQAADLLVGTGQAVKQVARAVGYSDPLYFSRVFKRHYGISPSGYR